MSEQVLNNEQHAVDSENRADVIFEFYLENGKAATLEKFGISEIEFMNLLSYPQVEEYDRREGNNVEGVNQSMFAPVTGIGLMGNRDKEGNFIKVSQV
jgi:hypothetical protein